MFAAGTGEVHGAHLPLNLYVMEGGQHLEGTPTEWTVVISVVARPHLTQAALAEPAHRETDTHK